MTFLTNPRFDSPGRELFRRRILRPVLWVAMALAICALVAGLWVLRAGAQNPSLDDADQDRIISFSFLRAEYGQVDAAIETLTSLWGSHRANGEAGLALAILQFAKAGNPEGAAETLATTLQEARAAGPGASSPVRTTPAASHAERVALMVLLGDFYRLAGRSDQAVQLYRQALQADPKLAHASCELARVLTARGDLKGADKAIQDALDANPEFPAALVEKGRIKRLLAQRDEAVAALRKALEYDPGDADAYLELGRVYEDMGRKQDAIFAYQQALQADPGLAEAKQGLNRLRGR